MSDKLSVERVRGYKVDEALVTDIQSLARDSWGQDLASTRTQEEVNYRFPLLGKEFEAAGAIYRGFARHGRLIVARRHGKLVGFATMRNTVSTVSGPQASEGQPGIGAILERTAKRVHGALRPDRSRVYPNLANIVVDPDHWREGIGSAMLNRACHGFNMHQTATAYVFDETFNYDFDNNAAAHPQPEQPVSQDFNRSQEFLAASGFKPVNPQSLVVRKDYFGPGSKPVMQYKLANAIDYIQVATKQSLQT